MYTQWNVTKIRRPLFFSYLPCGPFHLTAEASWLLLITLSKNLRNYFFICDKKLLNCLRRSTARHRFPLLIKKCVVHDGLYIKNGSLKLHYKNDFMLISFTFTYSCMWYVYESTLKIVYYSNIILSINKLIGIFSFELRLLEYLQSSVRTPTHI